MINNVLSSPFKVKTILPKEGNVKIVELIKRLSKIHGKPKQLVEREILERSKLNEI